MSIKFWIVVTALVLATVATVDAIVDVIVYYVYKIDVAGITGIAGANDVAVVIVADYEVVEVVIGVDRVWFTTLYMIYYIEKISFIILLYHNNQY